MRVIIGSDHGGYDLKEICKAYLEAREDVQLTDAGVFDRVAADYPRVAHIIARAVAGGEYDRGILICGTGIGMSIAANRHRGVRAAVCDNVYTAKMSRLHNDANILAMGGRVIGSGVACDIMEIFLATGFEGGRHRQRLDQIDP